MCTASSGADELQALTVVCAVAKLSILWQQRMWTLVCVSCVQYFIIEESTFAGYASQVWNWLGDRLPYPLEVL